MLGGAESSRIVPFLTANHPGSSRFVLPGSLLSRVA